MAETLFEPYMIPFLKSQVKTWQWLISSFCVLCLRFLYFFTQPQVIPVWVKILVFQYWTLYQDPRGWVLRIPSERDDWRGFLGFEIFDFGILGGKKILVSIFWGSLILGFQNNLKIRDSSRISWPHSSSGNFYGLEIRHGIFWGLNFDPGIFGGVFWKP